MFAKISELLQALWAANPFQAVLVVALVVLAFTYLVLWFIDRYQTRQTVDRWLDVRNMTTRQFKARRRLL